jgi:hypothetical protein
LYRRIDTPIVAAPETSGAILIEDTVHGRSGRILVVIILLIIDRRGGYAKSLASSKVLEKV